MTVQKSIDITKLKEQAISSPGKEIYLQIKKTQSYRIGVGARANQPASSFFVEIIIMLSPEIGEVDFQRFENVLACLKALKARGYALTFEDGNCISCETTRVLQNPTEEYRAIKILIQEAKL